MELHLPQRKAPERYPPFSILEADRMNGTKEVGMFIYEVSLFQYPRSGSNEWNFVTCKSRKTQ